MNQLQRALRAPFACRTFALAFLLGAFATRVAAQEEARDSYYDLSLDEVAFDGGVPPGAWILPTALLDRWATFHPRVWIEGGGETYLVSDPLGADPNAVDAVRLVARVPGTTAARGVLHLPDTEGEERAPHPFTLDASRADPNARVAFLRGRYVHYADLRESSFPGSAWFRHVAEKTRRELLALGSPIPDLPPRAWSFTAAEVDDLADTYALFSGGRALSENLELDRVLRTGEELEPTIPVDEIEGITIQEFDWRSLLEGEGLLNGAEPELDPLAAHVPADQHALFFSSFQALVDLVDEFEGSGAPILALFEPQAEDARTLERYQEQMCLPLDELARAVGGMLVTRLAITGSDPYLRTGSDVAVLFETERPDVLLAFVRNAQREARQRIGGAAVNGMIGTLQYEGVDSGDWELSSYVARAGDAVVVTNALHQLEVLSQILENARPALTTLPEYAFFRARYPLGEAGESAFLMLSDATIRRWCGPRWRIGASRRIRAAAVLAEEQAAHLTELVSGSVEPRVLREELPVPGGGAVRLEPEGAVSDVFGSSHFLTPIAMLDLELVTADERSGYVRFRDLYQASWQQYFDPIGARLARSEGVLALDVTVMPLIAGTEYRELVDLAGSVQLEPWSGDPHPEALLHFIYALDHEAPTFKDLESDMQVLPISAGSALGWVGESFELYVDRDVVWEGLAEMEDPDDFLEEHFYEIPIAISVAVRDPLRLTVFLTALRTFSEQSAPGLVRWEAREHRGQPYVAILPVPDEMMGLDLEHFGIFYAPGPETLVLSLREDVVQRALERRIERAAGIPADVVPEKQELRPWLGRSLAARIEREGGELMLRLFGDEWRRRMQASSWGNLPILNEWRRLFPDRDPVDVHERFFDVRLADPEGGRYVWNEENHTMESTVYGHPGEPKLGPRLPAALERLLRLDLGLTFEHDGLRARAELAREER